jgi:undecaprenyl-diphosphatase
VYGIFYFKEQKILFEAIILGIVQGLTEFIPVSSSGHLILFPWFFDWHGEVDTLGFSVALHCGTLIALVSYFRKELIDIVVHAWSKDALLWKIILANIPAATVGILFHDQIAGLRNPLLVAFTLAFVALLMILAERRKNTRIFEDIALKDALFIGAAQACALIPGVSRSGITITAALSRGIKRDAGAEFSFLLSAPVIAGAGLLETVKLVREGSINYSLFFTGMITSAIVGYMAIKYLLIFLKRYSLRSFAYYRFVLSFVIIVMFLWIR